MHPVPDPQPIKGVLVMRGVSQADVARQVGCSRKWVYLVVNGRVPAPDRFKHAVAGWLGLPVEALFRDGDRAGAA
jgi:transcriptional regulator with XRE-family HTH domain